jgi:hypothetical protein
VKKFVFASLLGTAVMLAAQAPAPATSTTPSQPASASTSKVKKHHKKTVKKADPVVNANTAKPAPAK